MDNETKREFLNHILSNPCNIIGQVVLEQNNTIYVGQGLETAAESMDGSGTAAQKTGEQEAATGNKPATADIDSRVRRAIITVYNKKLLQKTEFGLIGIMLKRANAVSFRFDTPTSLHKYITSLNTGIHVSLSSVKLMFFEKPKFNEDGINIPDMDYETLIRLKEMYNCFMNILSEKE